MRAEWQFLKGDGSVDDLLDAAPLDARSLSEWVAERMGERACTKRQVVNGSRLNQTFAYQILAGTRRPSRDKLIQLAFGLGLGVDEASDLLERGGAARLQPSSRRDVIVAFALSRGMDVTACDDLLYDHHEATLLLGR